MKTIVVLLCLMGMAGHLLSQNLVTSTNNSDSVHTAFQAKMNSMSVF
ncbi:MAG: hypothetical protein R3279_08500 [Putridiphycobacter sp.]|nr:hypothetical protein [Putridiphycobacter sp.]